MATIFAQERSEMVTARKGRYSDFTVVQYAMFNNNKIHSLNNKSLILNF